MHAYTSPYCPTNGPASACTCTHGSHTYTRAFHLTLQGHRTSESAQGPNKEAQICDTTRHASQQNLQRLDGIQHSLDQNCHSSSSNLNSRRHTRHGRSLRPMPAYHQKESDAYQTKNMLVDTFFVCYARFRASASLQEVIITLTCQHSQILRCTQFKRQLPTTQVNALSQPFAPQRMRTDDGAHLPQVGVDVISKPTLAARSACASR